MPTSGNTEKSTPIDRCTKIPISELTTPKHGYFTYVDYYWIITTNSEALFYKGHTPQCNRSEQIAESIKNKLYPDCHVQFLPVAYIKWVA